MLQVFLQKWMLIKVEWSRTLWIYKIIYWKSVLFACVASLPVVCVPLTGFRIWLFVVTKEYNPERLRFPQRNEEHLRPHLKLVHKALNAVTCGGKLYDSGCGHYKCGCEVPGRSQSTCTPGVSFSPQTTS